MNCARRGDSTGAEAIGGAAAADEEAYGLGILEDGRGVCAKCHVQMANGWVANFICGMHRLLPPWESELEDAELKRGEDRLALR